MYDRDTALIVVDVQNDFAHPDGSLFVPGGDGVVAAVNREVARAREAGALVAYTQDWHPERTPHFVTDGGQWPVHCVQGTWGAELHADLDVDGPVVRKGVDGGDGYSGFSVRDPETGAEAPTSLERILRERGVSKAVVVGLAQDVCVKETVLDAARLGFDTHVIGDATAPVEAQPGDAERATEAMAGVGAHLH